jgi:hypothetical protein
VSPDTPLRSSGGALPETIMVSPIHWVILMAIGVLVIGFVVVVGVLVILSQRWK